MQVRCIGEGNNTESVSRRVFKVLRFTDIKPRVLVLRSDRNTRDVRSDEPVGHAKCRPAWLRLLESLKLHGYSHHIIVTHTFDITNKNNSVEVYNIESIIYIFFKTIIVS